MLSILLHQTQEGPDSGFSYGSMHNQNNLSGEIKSQIHFMPQGYTKHMYTSWGLVGLLYFSMAQNVG